MILPGSLLVLMLLAPGAQDDEAKKRDAFAKEFKDKSPAKRVEAVGKMNGSVEDKSIVAVARGLSDAAGEVRKAAAACLETCTDSGGSALKPLCAILKDKKEDRDLRLACAKALAKGEYKAEATDAMIQAITIDEKDKDLYQFGAELTKILDAFAGQDFGMTKETPAKWQTWSKQNQAMLAKQDAEKLAAWKKSAGKGK